MMQDIFECRSRVPVFPTSLPDAVAKGREMKGPVLLLDTSDCAGGGSVRVCIVIVGGVCFWPVHVWAAMAVEIAKGMSRGRSCEALSHFFLMPSLVNHVPVVSCFRMLLLTCCMHPTYIPSHCLMLLTCIPSHPIHTTQRTHTGRQAGDSIQLVQQLLACGAGKTDDEQCIAMVVDPMAAAKCLEA